MTTPAPMTLGDVFTIPDVVANSDFVLQLQTGIEKPEQTVAAYVVTDSIAASFDAALGYVNSALTSKQDRGVFLHGTFGSGKSHFMAVLDLLLRGEPVARRIAGLQAAVAKYESVLATKLLTIEYNLNSATSLEDKLFSGYLQRMAALHPGAALPLLHKSDALFTDAQLRRDAGSEAFFAQLNYRTGSGAAASGWGTFESSWDSVTFDAAVAQPVGDPQRERLATDLIATMFTGYTSAGEWLDIDTGLGLMSSHAQSLGYQGVVLFLDELVLWLATHLGDRDFVSTEGAKVAKLVETGMGQRAIPLISFVARQQELQTFYSQIAGASGAETVSVGQSFQYWEGRFETVQLAASNLPDIAHRRLLTPKDQAGTQAVANAIATLKKHPQSWDALLLDEQSSGEAAFAKVYPFSPALVDTLVFLSGMMQRERTALKVMAELLSQGRDTSTIDQIIPVAALYDVLVASSEQPLTEDVRNHFDVARRLYQDKFRPVLLDGHGLTEAQIAGLDRNHGFFVDDRLAKTLLIASLVNVPALKDLNAARLAALNHGSIKAFIPGGQASTVLTKVRMWAERIGELDLSDGPDPEIKLVLAGVDYESVLQKVQIEDNPGTRRTLMRRLVFEQFGVGDVANLFGSVTEFALQWRGTKRRLQVVFGNIRDEESLPENVLRAEGDEWRVVVDYPFDVDNHVPADDVDRFDRLRIDGVESRTVGWVPRFLSAARQEDLGTLVQLEFLLGGEGDQFDLNAQHLPSEQRPMAKSLLENKRRALRDRLLTAMKQAYGLAAPQAGDVDLVSAGDELNMWPTLDSIVTVQPPVGATLGDALRNLGDQLLTAQFPDHPKFDGLVRPVDVGTVLEYVKRAVAQPSGRVDPVETTARNTLRKIANPLKCGECYESHYVFSSATFPWRNEFLRLAAEQDASGGLTVKRIREHLADRGLLKDVQNLLIASWALLDDKQFVRHGAPIDVSGINGVFDDLELRDPQLPDPAPWDDARACAAALLGVSIGPMRTASNLAALCAGVRKAVAERELHCRDLVAELEEHAAVLGIDATSPRLRTARTTSTLLTSLARTDDDMALVGALAGFDLPAESQAISRSITTAADVARALKSAQWDILDGVALKTEGQDGPVLADLRQAAPDEQFHSKLEVALGSATTKANAYLLSLAPAPVTPGPTPPPDNEPPPAHVNDVIIDGLDQLTNEVAQIQAAMESEPNRRLFITWRLE